VLDQKPNILLVIATYNERENLPALVEDLVERLPDLKILVIDDGSPDGTGAWCEAAKKQFSQLSVVHRPGKQGLGSATLLGFAHALEQDFEYVATMDADFSHDPASLVDLVRQAVEKGSHRAGVVIGSRYVAGGRIIGWPWHRKFASRAVNFYARLLLRLNTRDNSSAFRVYRTEILRAIDVASLRSSGYGYLEEILWRLKRTGVEAIELPITFRDRERGHSKASVKVGLSVVWQITNIGLGLWK
jgi:dolichol-phosphate mannosyltransferase